MERRNHAQNRLPAVYRHLSLRHGAVSMRMAYDMHKPSSSTSDTTRANFVDMRFQHKRFSPPSLRAWHRICERVGLHLFKERRKVFAKRVA